ncbi:hypothetical protein R3P38DRAFT_906538 [Favolaschia claudopus]|uniref:Uncharacterized protein n=1 Tax=Favolaschia claudopus TaxID=2862362 RepID=A0AAV9Z031_9AGAR
MPSGARYRIWGADRLLPRRTRSCSPSADGHALPGVSQLRLPAGRAHRDKDPRSFGFKKSLLSHGIVRVLIRAMNSLSKTTSGATLLMLRKCFRLTNILLMTPIGFADLPTALNDGLLRTLVVCALSPFAHDLHPQFAQYLVHWFPPCLSNHTFVSALDSGLHGVSDLINSDLFKSSELCSIWDTFFGIARRPLEVLRAFSARPASSVLKACDNPECLKIDAKAAF